MADYALTITLPFFNQMAMKKLLNNFSNLPFHVSLIGMVCSSLLLPGCFRPDVPVAPFQPDPSSQVMEISMASYDASIGDTRYNHQIYFTLSTGEQKTVDRLSWDLGFSASETGTAVILNGANFMQIALAEGKTFGDPWTTQELTSLVFRFDSATGSLDHTAIGEWAKSEENSTFVLDLGYDHNLSARGHRQLQILRADAQEFEIRYADLDGNNVRTAVIPKRSGHNFSFYSLVSEQMVEVEPPQDSWDLVFTYYAYRYPDGFPYWLTGALSNRHQVAVAEVPTSFATWDELTLADTASLTFSPNIDEIGFDWKSYVFGPPARYVTHQEKCYVVRDTKGYFYRLRFLDFYNDQGWKGFPQIEYSLLP